jgi:tetratricopeptide (TPR) repeat protein
MNKRHIVLQFIAAVVLGVLVIGAPTFGQSTSDDYRHSASLAEGYMQERRFEDALAMFRKAYEAKPDPKLLNRMGAAFMALGMQTEAEDVFRQVLSQGGEINLTLWHLHGMSHCVGNLRIAPGQISWFGKDDKDSFKVTPSEAQVESIREFHRGAPELKLRALGKTWRFQYMLYGPGQYQVDGFSIVYQDGELESDRKAVGLIASLIPAAASAASSVASAPKQAPASEAPNPTETPASVPSNSAEGAQSLVEQGNVKQAQSATSTDKRQIFSSSTLTLEYEDLGTNAAFTVELPDQWYASLYFDVDQNGIFDGNDVMYGATRDERNCAAVVNSLGSHRGCASLITTSVLVVTHSGGRKRLRWTIPKEEISRNATTANLLLSTYDGNNWTHPTKDPISVAMNASSPVASQPLANEPRSEPSVKLRENQTPEEVERALGKPDDITTVSNMIIYTYPTVKVFFENGKLVNVEERKK